MTTFKIKASEDFITPGIYLELIAVSELADMRQEIISVAWSCDTTHPHIKLYNNKLYLTESISNLEQLTIIATDAEVTVSRSFKIINSPRSGKLVHFIKHDNMYKGHDFAWDLWVYSDNNSAPQAIDFSAYSDFGNIALINHDYAIARKKTWGINNHNNWSEQTPSFKLNLDTDHYYIIYGEEKVYTDLIDVINYINPCIEYARMDNNNTIIAYLSHTPLTDTTFELYINSTSEKNVSVSVLEGDKQVIFTNLPKDIQAHDLIVIKANQTFSPCKVTMRNYLDQFYYTGNDMGITFSNSSITLRIWAPTAQLVELLVYQEWINQPDSPSDCLILNSETENGTHVIEINRHKFENMYYLYRLTFADIDSHGKLLPKITYAVDPYAHGCSRNGECGVLLDLNSPEATPSGWYQNKKPHFIAKEDAVIYELHTRDFSIDPSSNINNNSRGKYLGLVETGCTHANNNISVTTGIDSLVELGITHVHLLPIFDFATVDEAKLHEIDNRNWGYDPQNYNIPDGSYTTNPNNPFTRIKELRYAIYQLHKNGLRVVMDIVYNHMFTTANFDNIVPKYYFRTNNEGYFTNGSGCGNELATERPMVSKFIIDSIHHWLIHYKIDGLRLDLMELMDLNTMKSIVKEAHLIDPSILIYGEPWKGGESPLINGTYRGSQRNSNFSIFNDIFRDAIRGNNNPGNGFVNGNSHNNEVMGKLIEGLKGSIFSLTENPGESINYIDAHDNYTLWDHIEKSQHFELENGSYRQNLPSNLFESSLVRQNILALGIILTAQGIPFLQGGVEILRTKQGDHNSYKSNDETNAIHWQDKITFKPVFDYVKGLIELRQAHPAFRMTNPQMIKDSIIIFPANNDMQSGVIVSHFKNYANNDSWEDIIVIYNATTIDDYSITNLVPQIENKLWHVVVNHEQAGVKKLLECTHSTLPKLKSHSMLVIHTI